MEKIKLIHFQGLTLEEVIIDFSEDKALKIRNFVHKGTLYVALTRVKHGSKVFLKSFQESYILADKALKLKVDAFVKFNGYTFKKVYLDEQIFEDENHEIKLGYLNVNGLMEGSHGYYLNADRNLLSLDLLAIAETHLTPSTENSEIQRILTNWTILKRFDADGSKHMGILLLVPNEMAEEVKPHIDSFMDCPLRRNGRLQIQALRVKFVQGLDVTFIYCRSTPTEEETDAISKEFENTHFLIGDLNLSRKSTSDKRKLDKLCSEDKFLVLNEITRITSSNQLDHIIGPKFMKDKSYATSYLNFMSDHKSITLRIASETEAQFTKEFRQRITFCAERHKKKNNQGTDQRSESNPENGNKNQSDKRSEIVAEDQETVGCSNIAVTDVLSNLDVGITADPVRRKVEKTQKWRRRFKNEDMTTCWLNACLQLILNGMDHYPHTLHFDSPLGLELQRLQNSKTELDPSIVKDILVREENIRHENDPMSQYLDLRRGQQCVRDFFLALRENMYCWPEVFSLFCFQLTVETRCGNKRCNKINSSTNPPQLCIELEVPDPGTDLSYVVEQELDFTFKDVEGYHCETREGGCGETGIAGHRTVISRTTDQHFIMVQLRRAISTPLGYYNLNRNRVNATGDIRVVDNVGSVSYFDPIAVIDHIGSVSSSGDSRGHYLCDVRTKNGVWMHTDDNKEPIQIRRQNVSKQGAVILYYKRAV